MNIRKQPNNIVLTYCNFCGKLTGSQGRIDLDITFDKDMIKNMATTDTKISANICPECADKITSNLESMIQETDERVTELKVKMGLEFSELISNTQVESKELPNPEESIQEEPTLEPIDELDNLNILCEVYEGPIENVDNFINDFFNSMPSKSNIDSIDVETSMEYISEIISRYNQEYKLIKSENKYFIEKVFEEEIEEPVEEVSDKSCQSWSPEDVRFLIENYEKLGSKECGKILGRSARSCAHKFNRSVGGNYRHKSSWFWSDEEIEYLKNSYGKVPVKQIAEVLNRPMSSCYAKIKSLRE